MMDHARTAPLTVAPPDAVAEVAKVSGREITLALEPGRYLLQVCSTLSCQLCGTGELVGHLKGKLGIDFGETTLDGRFTLVDVQCLGACGEAPVVQINNDYYTGLTVERLDALLDRFE